MFENLQNPNQPNRPQVDDIFADTDQATDAQPAMRNQENLMRGAMPTASSGSMTDPGLDGTEKKGGKGFMIAVVMMSVIILGLVGYLVYSKFFKNSEEVIIPVEEGIIDEETGVEAATTTEDSTEEADATSTTEAEAGAGDEFIDFLPVAPGGEDSEAEGAGGFTDEPVIDDGAPVLPVSPVDSDGDGLTDEEEASLGTNPNIIDSDNDGLSDYEEVKIYQTNPLVVDTDGDSYPDGTEVRGGYNPNGEGKLPGNN